MADDSKNGSGLLNRARAFISKQMTGEAQMSWPIGTDPRTTPDVRPGGPQSKPGLLDELGVTGLRRWAWGYGKTTAYGLVYEEFLQDLVGYQKAYRVYREMRDNDAVVGAVLLAVETLLRNVTWHVEGENDQDVEFLESLLQDMEHTWEEFIAEVLSMVPYGYAWHEIVYKRRMGDNPADPTRNSRYKDGKIGWRKLPIRSQDTLLEWAFNEHGDVTAFVQLAPPTFIRTEIPMENGLLFRVTSHKNNPEGRPLLRSSFRSWYMKRRIEEYEAIGIERDLAGLPVIYRTADVATKYDAQLKQILQNVRRDEQDGLLLPLVWNDKGNKDLEFSLLSTGGTRQFDTSAVITRYNQSIAMTMLAEFMMLGQQSHGSYALAASKVDMFNLALSGIMKSIAAVINRYAIPRLWKLNGWPLEHHPVLVPGNVSVPDLAGLGAWITALAGAGAPLFPDDELENVLRSMASLPQKATTAPPPSPTIAPSGAGQYQDEISPDELAGGFDEQGQPVKPKPSKPNGSAGTAATPDRARQDLPKPPSPEQLLTGR